MILADLFPGNLVTDEVFHVLAMTFALLILFSSIFYCWGKVSPQKDLSELVARTKSWWIMVALLVVVLFLNKVIATIGLAFLSFIALRELISNLELRHSDRRVIFWCFLAIPIQFYLAYKNSYDLFIIFIPVVMFLLLPFRAVIVGDTLNVTRSFAVLQWSIMLTVFSISHIAFLLNQDLSPKFSAGSGGLILYLLFLTQFNDVLQFLWGKALGKRKILPKVSPNKTWEGFVGGVLTTALLGYFLRFLTPFNWHQALLVGLAIGVAGFCGDVVISCIKRDYQIKDMGNLIPGHGGVMDRIDSLSYTSLVFMHLTYYLTLES